MLESNTSPQKREAKPAIQADYPEVPFNPQCWSRLIKVFPKAKTKLQEEIKKDPRFKKFSDSISQVDEVLNTLNTEVSNLSAKSRSPEVLKLAASLKKLNGELKPCYREGSAQTFDQAIIGAALIHEIEKVICHSQLTAIGRGTPALKKLADNFIRCQKVVDAIETEKARLQMEIQDISAQITRLERGKNKTPKVKEKEPGHENQSLSKKAKLKAEKDKDTQKENRVERTISLKLTKLAGLQTELKNLSGRPDATLRTREAINSIAENLSTKCEDLWMRIYKAKSSAVDSKLNNELFESVSKDIWIKLYKCTTDAMGISIKIDGQYVKPFAGSSEEKLLDKTLFDPQDVQSMINRYVDLKKSHKALYPDEKLTVFCEYLSYIYRKLHFELGIREEKKREGNAYNEELYLQYEVTSLRKILTDLPIFKGINDVIQGRTNYYDGRIGLCEFLAVLTLEEGLKICKDPHK